MSVYIWINNSHIFWLGRWTQLYFSVSLPNSLNNLRHPNHKQILKISPHKPLNKFLQNKPKIPIREKSILLLLKKLLKFKPTMILWQRLHLQIFSAINPTSLASFKTKQMTIKVSLISRREKLIFLIIKVMIIQFLKISKAYFLCNQIKAIFSKSKNPKEIFLLPQIISQTN